MEDESKAKGPPSPSLRRDTRGLYTFLRNEPIYFMHHIRCITFIYKNLCRLQRRLQMGSFPENEPILGGI